MADKFCPLRHGTIMMFGSLEFMSLGSFYDMVLLPTGDDTEPYPEPISPQPVHGRRSGHHAGGPGAGVRGPASLIVPPRPGLVRPSPCMFLTRLPIPLDHVTPGEGPVEHQALLHGPTGGHRDPLVHACRRAKHGSHLLLKRRTRGLRLLCALPRRPKLRRES